MKVKLIFLTVIILSIINCITYTKLNYEVPKQNIREEEKLPANILFNFYDRYWEYDRSSLSGRKFKDKSYGSMTENFSKELEKHFLLKDDSKFKVSVKTSLQKEEYHPYTYLTFLSLCILPCGWTNKYIHKVEYLKYDDVIKKEEYSTDKVSIGFLLFGSFYVSDEIDPNPAFLPILPHFKSEMAQIINDENRKANEIIQKENNEWLLIKGKKCKDIYEFWSNVSKENNELDKEVQEHFNNCIYNKTKKYLSQKYPFLKPHLEKEITAMSGENIGVKVKELWNVSILAKNPTTGYKLTDKEIILLQKNKENFILKLYSLDGGGGIVEFRATDKFFNISSLKDNRGKTMTEDWTAKILIDSLSGWPKGENWDWEFIDSIGK